MGTPDHQDRSALHGEGRAGARVGLRHRVAGLTLAACGPGVAVHAVTPAADRVAAGPTPAVTAQGTARPEEAGSAVCRGRRSAEPGATCRPARPPSGWGPEGKPSAVSWPRGLSRGKAPGISTCPDPQRQVLPCPGLAGGAWRSRCTHVKTTNRAPFLSRPWGQARVSSHLPGQRSPRSL